MFEYITAKKHCSYNREELKASRLCGCIWCLEVYPASEISQWHQEDINGVEQTAICARCNNDAILGDAAGFPLSAEFLTAMRNYWMEAVKEYSAAELVNESTINFLNEYVLGKKSFRVEIGEEVEPYTNYLVYEGDEEIFRTIFPRELLIKVAQLLPDSEVRICTDQFAVGDSSVSQETLTIRVHCQ